MTLRGPYGEFLLEDESYRGPVFLATGTGVAPLKSTIEYVFETGRDRHGGETPDVWLFLGAAWKDELLNRTVFETLATEQDNFHFMSTLSRESYLTPWVGETNYVQHVLVKYLNRATADECNLPAVFEQYRDEPPAYLIHARLDPASMEVYACGINAMGHRSVDTVERLGVPPERT